MSRLPSEEFYQDLSDLSTGGIDIPISKEYNLDWVPDMGPTQRKAYFCKASEILIYGEKFSGKTYVGGGHKLIHHCVHNFNALAAIIVGSRGQAQDGGIWTKLITEILPEWEREMGLEFTEPKLDSQNRPEFWIRNKFNGWSKVKLVSLQYGEQIKSRFRGMEPSYVFADEVTLMPSDVFVWVNLQIGRDRHIDFPQWVGATNPDGPSHWVFETFWKEVGFADQEQKRPASMDRQVFHIPYTENERFADPRYIARVKRTIKHDKVEYDRMVLGIWVDRPSGLAIFNGYYDALRHERPLLNSASSRLVPHPAFPIIIGYDPGQTHNAIIMMQYLKGKDRAIWMVFDEIVYIKEKISYALITLNLMRKMQMWNDYWKERKSDFKGFRFIHVSDSSATNQYRPGGGESYDCLEFERNSAKYIEQNELFKGMSPIEIEECPKYDGSKQDRVKIMWKLLTEDRFMVSRNCTHVIGMMNNLESEKQKEGKYDPDAGVTPRRSKYIHTFDGMTYPILMFDISDMEDEEEGSEGSGFTAHDY